jgi:hypothetical protein
VPEQTRGCIHASPGEELSAVSICLDWGNLFAGPQDGRSHLLIWSVSILASLDWRSVREHYDLRESTHKKLLSLYRNRRTTKFVDLLLGISDPSGNYSASEHGIGPKILAENLNPDERLVAVAEKFLEITNAHEVPVAIRHAGLKYFQIGVGSEASCMVNPQFCWVANVRTIWTHLVHKHSDDFSKADAELRLYREADVDSEMAYQMWRDLHAELAGTATRISEQGARLAQQAGVEPGLIRYLWADAIANQLYADHWE